MSLLEEKEATFYAEITDEDLEVTERWLIKVSVIDNDGYEDEPVLISRKLVYELIQKFEGNNDASMELCFEVSKLPKIYLTDEQIKLLRSEGRFEIPIFDPNPVIIPSKIEKGGKENE